MIALLNLFLTLSFPLPPLWAPLSGAPHSGLSALRGPSLRYAPCHGEPRGGRRGRPAGRAAVAGQPEAPGTPHVWGLHHQRTLAGQRGPLLREVS